MQKSLKCALTGVLGCVLILFMSTSHAAVDWRFDIMTTQIVIAPSEYFEIVGSITNLEASTSEMDLGGTCAGCYLPVTLGVGSPTGEVFEQFEFDLWSLGDRLRGVRLAPGESFQFIAYTGSPRNSAAAQGTYDLAFHSLYLGQDLGSRFAGDLQITVVPEPEHWAMLLAGLGLTGWAARRRHQPSSSHHLAA